jgi:hypothetical protein
MSKTLSRGRIALAFVLLTACQAPRYTGANLEGKTAILDEVNIALSSQDCTSAIAAIEGIYETDYTDNPVRMARAAAHGCAAGVNFFKLAGDLTSNNIAGPGFWQTMTKLFPSTTLDTKVTSAWYATDALLAARNAGSVVAPANMVNVGTHNVGSLVPTDRTDDANAYLAFISMSMIGALQNRYSAPDAANAKTRPLGYKITGPTGWESLANLDEEGCSYAAAILNMLDGIGAILPKMSNATLATTLNVIGTTFNTALDDACDLGCRGVTVPGCAFPANTCKPCLRTIRSRASCTQGSATQASCAAAGLIYFINHDTTLGYGP